MAERLEVDVESGEKLYLQIARKLREDIISGKLPVGEPVPSGRAMYDSAGIGRKTYSEAMRELKREGLVVTRPGQGNYVATRPELRVVELGNGDQVASRPPTEEERGAHGVPLLSHVLVVTRADGRREIWPSATTVCRVIITGYLCPALG